MQRALSASGRIAALICLASVAAVTISPRAQADPADQTTHAMAEYVVQHGPTGVCPGLDAQPSSEGVAATVTGIAHDGWTTRQAAQILVVSVDFYCAGHDPLVRGYLSTNAPLPATIEVSDLRRGAGLLRKGTLCSAIGDPCPDTPERQQI